MVISEVLHIRPWELAEMSVEDVESAIAYIDDRNERASQR